LYYYAENNAKELEIELWKIEWNNIEILSNIPEDIVIITTDLKKFNPNIQTLSIKQDAVLWNQ
jgi:hypothetical protein